MSAPMRIEVHFFKESGKYYTTEDVEMTASTGLPRENFELSVYRAIEGRLRGMFAVSADPKLPWPMMFKVAAS